MVSSLLLVLSRLQLLPEAAVSRCVSATAAAVTLAGVCGPSAARPARQWTAAAAAAPPGPGVVRQWGPFTEVRGAAVVAAMDGAFFGGGVWKLPVDALSGFAAELLMPLRAPGVPTPLAAVRVTGRRFSSPLRLRAHGPVKPSRSAPLQQQHHPAELSSGDPIKMSGHAKHLAQAA
jgi:hypothetical protein